MPQTWIESPVAEALAQVLELYHPGNISRRAALLNKPYTVFSYLEDFDYLWSIWEDAETSLTSTVFSAGAAPTAIVVWDGIPASGSDINAGFYLTPFDWVLAWTRVLLARAKTQASKSDQQTLTRLLPELRVLILDLNPQQYRRAFGVHQFGLLSPTMPWIQTYAPVRNGNTEDDLRLDVLNGMEYTDLAISLVRSFFKPGFFGSETILADTLRPERILSLRDAYDIREQGDRSNLEITMDAFAGIWRSNMVRPGGRHQHANLLAPMILAKGLSEELRRKTEREIKRAHKLETALDALMMAVGLVSPPVLKDNSDQRTPSSPNGPSTHISSKGLIRTCGKQLDAFDQRRRIRFLLVDDHYDLGYQHILGSVLFGSQYKAPTSGSVEWLFSAKDPKVGFEWELRCTPTATSLFEYLNRQKPNPDWRQPRCFDAGMDILLLDLRLWPEVEEKSERNRLRQSFMSDLVDVCDHLKASDASGSIRLLDPHFDRAYLQACSLKEGRDVSELEALVLFPLLLSYYDPSLPIILFSSSHQRAVVEMVSHRPNIITDFAKPLLSGYGEGDTPSQLITDLHKALSKAMALHEARCTWNRIVDIEWTNNPVFEVRNSKKEYLIFNKPKDYEPRGDRNYAHEQVSQKPLIQKETLRASLASHFVNYIQHQRYFDFASVPWELIEATLVPRNILHGVYDPHFKIDPALHDDEYGPNYSSVVLENIRNKKTHGGGRPPKTAREEEDYRLAALLQLMILLDFIQGAQEAELASAPSAIDLWASFRQRHSDLKGGPRKLHELQPEVNVSWFEFVVYAGLRAVDLAHENGRRYLSDLTTLAAQRLATNLMGRP